MALRLDIRWRFQMLDYSWSGSLGPGLIVCSFLYHPVDGELRRFFFFFFAGSVCIKQAKF